MLAYTECMRDHGVDMPDPQTDGEGRTMVALDADPESGEFQEAQTACEPLMDNAISQMEIDPEREAEMKEQLLEYAACMRDHGIDMPDPTFGENGRVTDPGRRRRRRRSGRPRRRRRLRGRQRRVRRRRHGHGRALPAAVAMPTAAPTTVAVLEMQTGGS